MPVSVPREFEEPKLSEATLRCVRAAGLWMGIRGGREEKRLGHEVCVQGGLGHGAGVGRREERDGGTRVVDPAY